MDIEAENKRAREQSFILELEILSPSLGKWADYFINEHGNSVEDARNTLKEAFESTRKI